MANLYLNFRSDQLCRSVYPVVFLPDMNGWRDVKPPYRTLYFLTGYSGGALETATFTNFALCAAVHGIAIVMLDGDNSFYVDDEARGAMYSRFVGEELVEVTRNVLPLSTRREDTFIGGISMGGYGAFVNGMRYAQTFGAIAMLSPALDLYPCTPRNPESPVPERLLRTVLGDEAAFRNSYKDVNALAERAHEHPDAMPRVFLGCGRQDALVYRAGLELVNKLTKAGAEVDYYEAEGGHDHVFWKAAMEPLCAFLTRQKGE